MSARFLLGLKDGERIETYRKVSIVDVGCRCPDGCEI